MEGGGGKGGAEGWGGKGGAEVYGLPERYDTSEGAESCGIRCEGELGRCAAVSDNVRDTPMDVGRLSSGAISISAGES